MKKILTLAIAALIAAMFTSAAKADTMPGWYIGAGAAASFQTDTDTNIGGVNNNIDFDAGWGVLGSLGYAWSNGLRVEGELSQFRTNADKVNNANGINGRINNFGLFGNAYYDFQTGTRWTPYVGGGIGAVSVDVDHIGTLSNGGAINDSSVEFAYQGIAGVAYELDNNWAFTTDYRYIRTMDPSLKTTGGGKAEFENASHNLVVGVRYALHAPQRPAKVQEAAAPMPKVPAPAPVLAPVPQSYMVFFDFDKADVTPEAQRIIASAVEDLRKGGQVRIVVTGHTDTMGTDIYNQKLSERRANSVKSQMVKLGVNGADITANGVGKSGLLVQTADQIREAKNRRAEIVFTKPE